MRPVHFCPVVVAFLCWDIRQLAAAECRTDSLAAKAEDYPYLSHVVNQTVPVAVVSDIWMLVDASQV